MTGRTTEPTGQEITVRGGYGETERYRKNRKGREYEREGEATVNGNVNKNALVGKKVLENVYATFVIWASADLKTTPARSVSHTHTS